MRIYVLAETHRSSAPKSWLSYIDLLELETGSGLSGPSFHPGQPDRIENAVPMWVGSRVVACRLGPSNPLWKPSGSPSQSKKVADELGSISPHNVNIHVLLAGENASTYSSLLTARLLLIFVLTSCNSS